MRPRADLATAFARTAVEHYQRDDDGSAFPQSTRPDVVLAMLRLLDLPRGGTVIEVGTGSGFATAVLSRAVGPEGVVHTIDVDPVVADRARRLLAADGRTNTRVRTGDALRSLPVDGAADRLVAFVSVAMDVPASWVTAIRPGGLLVVPLRGPRRVVRHRRDPVDGTLRAERGIDAVFAAATPAPGP